MALEDFFVFLDVLHMQFGTRGEMYKKGYFFEILQVAT